MKRKKLILLLASIGFILALVLPGCAAEDGGNGTTAPGTNGSATDPILRVLNPKGKIIPVEMNPNAPRLDTIDGKTILYYESEATNMHMPELLRRLKQDHPTTTFIVEHVENFGDRNPTEVHLSVDGAIRGVSW